MDRQESGFTFTFEKGNRFYMIELTDLSDRSFVLNSELIESITSIPETKISLTNGNYYLVKETPSEIIEKVVKYKKSLKYKGS